MTIIDNLYFIDHFFVRLSPRVANFRYNELQNDVHLSFSYGASNKRYNVHVSRNIGQPENKPQIVIFKIEKELFQRALTILSVDIFEIFYRPLNVAYHQGLSKRRFAKKVKLLETKLPEVVELKMRDLFLNATIQRGSQLEIYPEIIDQFKKWASKKATQRLLRKQIIGLPWEISNQPKTGYLISPVYHGVVLISDGCYYVPKEDIEPIRILNSYLGDALTKRIIFKTLLAIKRVSIASSKADTLKYYDPIIFS